MELFTIPSAGAIIERTINGEKYVLIQERFKESLPSENGLLEIPGGKIREYENIYDCLRREVEEETGLEITKIQGEEESIIVEYCGYKVLNYTPFTCAQNIEGYYPVMVEVFICEARGNLLTHTNETKNIRWISLDKLRSLLQQNEKSFYPMHLIQLKKYLNLERRR